MSLQGKSSARIDTTERETRHDSGVAQDPAFAEPSKRPRFEGNGWALFQVCADQLCSLPTTKTVTCPLGEIVRRKIRGENGQLLSVSGELDHTDFTNLNN